jgi:hypothetical protein
MRLKNLIGTMRVILRKISPISPKYDDDVFFGESFYRFHAEHHQMTGHKCSIVTELTTHTLPLPLSRPQCRLRS